MLNHFIFLFLIFFSCRRFIFWLLFIAASFFSYLLICLFLIYEFISLLIYRFIDLLIYQFIDLLIY